MPNWTTNYVKMRNIANLDIYTDDDQHEVDFNKIIPMNEELNITSGGIQDIAIRECLRYIIKRLAYPYFDGISDKTFINMLEDLKQSEDHDKYCLSVIDKQYKEKGITDFVNYGFKYLSNIVKYGYPTWYDWCNANWNTKWNAYDTETISDDEIIFQTAWDSPDPIFLELSKMHPYDEIKVQSAYEGDYIVHEASYLDGSAIEDNLYELSNKSDELSELENRKLIRKYEGILGNYFEDEGYVDPIYQEYEDETIDNIRKINNLPINLVMRIEEK